MHHLPPTVSSHDPKSGNADPYAQDQQPPPPPLVISHDSSWYPPPPVVLSSTAAAGSSTDYLGMYGQPSSSYHAQHPQTSLPSLSRYHQPLQSNVRRLDALENQQQNETLADPLPSMEWRHYYHQHYHPHADVQQESNQSTSPTPTSLETLQSSAEQQHFGFEAMNYSSPVDETSECGPSTSQDSLPNFNNQDEGEMSTAATILGRRSSRIKPHSTPATLCWLERNYELSEGVCIPRNVVYFNYVDFCSKNHMQPVNAASFGKIIRQMFANLTTRRLGTRGQSRYHYYGLAVKPDSIYYSPNYSSRKIDHMESKFYHSRLSVGQPSDHPTDHQSQYVSPGQPPPSVVHRASNQTGSNNNTACFAAMQQLPEFPSLKQFSHQQTSSIPSDKLQTLIMMYRAHCQRIMDSINKFSFTEIPHLFTHFWQEIPPHIAGLLGQNVVVTLIGVCDAILYQTILKAILPTAIQIFPENVLKIVRKFAEDIVSSLQYSLKQVPENLIYVKMKLVRQLSKMLKRRTSVNHLYQAACLVINPSHPAVYDQMALDWKKVEMRKCVEDSGTKACSIDEIRSVLFKFSGMIEQKCSMAQLCLWVSGLVDVYVASKSSSDKMAHGSQHQQPSLGLVTRIRRFLSIWTSVSAKVLRQVKHMKPNGSASSFHLVQLMLNEFILHEIERLICEDSMRELMLNMVNSQATELSDSSFIDSLGPDFLSNPNIFHQQQEIQDQQVQIGVKRKSEVGDVPQNLVKMERLNQQAKSEAQGGGEHYWPATEQPQIIYSPQKVAK